MWQINKSPNRGQIRGFSWNLENQLYRLHFEVQKIFLYASLNVPRGVFHRGVKPPNSEKVYHKCVVAQWLPLLTDYDRVRLTFWPVKFLTPIFFLKNYWTYAKKWGSVKRSHPWAPWGPQGGFKGARPSKTRKLPSSPNFWRNIFFSFMASSRT